MISFDFFGNVLFSAATFVCLISVVVFIHEFGHYVAAKMCKVRVESFSIGFGKELFGFYSKSGTRWKICIAPLGGYVKMFGDSKSDGSAYNEDEQKGAFCCKPRYKKAIIVFAGPAFNLVSAFLMLFLLFSIAGTYVITPEIGGVYGDSPADKAGLLEGDIIKDVAGHSIQDFSDIAVVMNGLKEKNGVDVVFSRGGETKKVQVDLSSPTNNDGTKRYLLGIIASGSHSLVKVGIYDSLERSFRGIASIVHLTVSAVGRIITGDGIKEIGGPIRIAKYSADSVRGGAYHAIWFLIVISVNLGVMNLLPIPMLDGGYLFQYLVEVVFLRGKSAGEGYQKVATICGMVLVLLLMIFATFNDLKYVVGN